MSKKSIEIEPFLKREVLSEQIVRQLLELVQSGALQPGDKLPGQRILAEKLGIGRPTLREALRALQLLGILDIHHGGGVYVSEIQPDTLLGPMHLFVSLDQNSMATILEARKVIEGAVLAVAAKKISAEAIERLNKNLTKLELAIQKLDEGGAEGLEGIDLNVLAQDFRSIVAEAVDNPLLARSIKSLDVLSSAARMRVNEMSSPKVLLVNHQRMVEALVAHDPVAAQQALEDHISYLQTFNLSSDEE